MRRRGLTLLVVVTMAVAAGVAILAAGTAVAVQNVTELHPQTTWAACNANAHSSAASTFTPLSDQAAAALITHEPETRADNATAFTLNGVAHAATTTYLPTAAQITAFRAAKTSHGQTAVQFNPYFQYVDGRDGLSNPSSDDLIQWTAHKWGIPENWLRAQYVLESYWNMWQLGDKVSVSSSAYTQYPPQSRVPNQLSVYQSLGIAQERWAPDGSVGVGAEPLRWESLAFNVDYQAAMVRFYYDNPQGARSAWGDSSYTPCQQWPSIGGWFSPYPWGNTGAQQYVTKVQQDLSAKTWQSSAFLNWTPPSLPPGVKLG